MSGQWPPEWEDSDTGLPDEWTPADGVGMDSDASEVSSFLATVPGPVLPADFEARISAALAAEASARAAGTTTSPALAAALAGPDDAKTSDRSSSSAPAPTATESGARTAAAHRRRPSAGSRRAARRSGPADSRPGGRRRRFRMPSSAVTAPVVILLVIVGFGILITRIGSSPSYSGSVATSGGSSVSSPAAAAGGNATGGTRYSASVPEDQKLPPRDDFVVTESGVSYHRSSLVSQVKAQVRALNSHTTPASSASSTSDIPSASASAASPAALPPSAALQGCVSRLAGHVTPSLVDKASYDGAPAYIIATATRVWVVRLDCTAADPQQITSVSLTG